MCLTALRRPRCGPSSCCPFSGSNCGWTRHPVYLAPFAAEWICFCRTSTTLCARPSRAAAAVRSSTMNLWLGLASSNPTNHTGSRYWHKFLRYLFSRTRELGSEREANFASKLNRAEPHIPGLRHRISVRAIKPWHEWREPPNNSVHRKIVGRQCATPEERTAASETFRRSRPARTDEACARMPATRPKRRESRGVRMIQHRKLRPGRTAGTCQGRRNHQTVTSHAVR